MKTILIASLTWLIFASPAFAQSPSLLDAANAAALVAHAADGMSTARCIGAGTCAEANPLLRPYVNKPPTFFIVKMGSAYASWIIKHKTKRDHPRLTLVFAIAETVGFSLIAHHNYQVSKR